LKFDMYWWSAFHLLAHHRGQAKVGSHQELFATRERLDGPHHAVNLWRVANGANRGFEFGRVRISRHRNYDLHIVGGGASFEMTFRFYQNLHSRVCMPFDDRLDPDKRLHAALGVETIGHQLKF